MEVPWCRPGQPSPVTRNPIPAIPTQPEEGYHTDWLNQSMIKRTIGNYSKAQILAEAQRRAAFAPWSSRGAGPGYPHEPHETLLRRFQPNPRRATSPTGYVSRCSKTNILDRFQPTSQVPRRPFFTSSLFHSSGFRLSRFTLHLFHASPFSRFTFFTLHLFHASPFSRFTFFTLDWFNQSALSTNDAGSKIFRSAFSLLRCPRGDFASRSALGHAGRGGELLRTRHCARNGFGLANRPGGAWQARPDGAVDQSPRGSATRLSREWKE